jgi:tripartite-type tricarboxylate transporter receptor subunit TctC
MCFLSFKRLFTAIVFATCAASTVAQPRVGRIVVGFAAGGTADLVARVVAEQIRADGGPNFLVENKTGAGGQIAVETVKSAEPDGNTLLFVPSSVMTVYPSVYKKLRYDPQTDFTPITQVVSFPMGVAVSSHTDVGSFQELVTQWRKAPTKASMGTPGAGTSFHFVTVQLQDALGLDIVHVPYRGGNPAIADVMAGHVSAIINPIGDFIPLQKQGKLNILAVTSPERSPHLPQVPTLRELGFPKVAVTSWYAFFAPAGTPEAVVQRLNTSIHKALRAPVIRDRLIALGFDVAPNSPAELAQQLSGELSYWRPLVSRSGFVAME